MWCLGAIHRSVSKVSAGVGMVPNVRNDETAIANAGLRDLLNLIVVVSDAPPSTIGRGGDGHVFIFKVDKVAYIGQHVDGEHFVLKLRPARFYIDFDIAFHLAVGYDKGGSSHLRV